MDFGGLRDPMVPSEPPKPSRFGSTKAVPPPKKFKVFPVKSVRKKLKKAGKLAAMLRTHFAHQKSEVLGGAFGTKSPNASIL